MNRLDREHEFFSWISSQREVREQKQKSQVSVESFDEVRKQRNYYKAMFEKLVGLLKADKKNN